MMKTIPNRPTGRKLPDGGHPLAQGERVMARRVAVPTDAEISRIREGLSSCAVWQGIRSAPLALCFSSGTVVGRSGFDAGAEVVSTVDECKMRERLRKIP